MCVYTYVYLLCACVRMRMCVDFGKACFCACIRVYFAKVSTRINKDVRASSLTIKLFIYPFTVSFNPLSAWYTNNASFFNRVKKAKNIFLGRNWVWNRIIFQQCSIMEKYLKGFFSFFFFSRWDKFLMSNRKWKKSKKEKRLEFIRCFLFVYSLVTRTKFF